MSTLLFLVLLVTVIFADENPGLKQQKDKLVHSVSVGQETCAVCDNKFDDIFQAQSESMAHIQLQFDNSIQNIQNSISSSATKMDSISKSIHLMKEKLSSIDNLNIDIQTVHQKIDEIPVPINNEKEMQTLASSVQQLFSDFSEHKNTAMVDMKEMKSEIEKSIVKAMQETIPDSQILLQNEIKRISVLANDMKSSIKSIENKSKEMIQELLDLEKRYSTKFGQMKHVQEMCNSQLLSMEEQLSIIEKYNQKSASSETVSMADVEQLLNEFGSKFNVELQAISDRTSREITANARQIDLVNGDQDNDQIVRQFKELKKSMNRNKKQSQERYISMYKELADLNSNLQIVNRNTMAYAMNAFVSDCYSYLYHVYKYIIDIEYKLYFHSFADERNWRLFYGHLVDTFDHVKFWVQYAAYPAMQTQFISFIHWLQLVTIHVSNGYQELHQHKYYRLFIGAFIPVLRKVIVDKSYDLMILDSFLWFLALMAVFLIYLLLELLLTFICYCICPKNSESEVNVEQEINNNGTSDIPRNIASKPKVYEFKENKEMHVDLDLDKQMNSLEVKPNAWQSPISYNKRVPHVQSQDVNHQQKNVKNSMVVNDTFAGNIIKTREEKVDVEQKRKSKKRRRKKKRVSS